MQPFSRDTAANLRFARGSPPLVLKRISLSVRVRAQHFRAMRQQHEILGFRAEFIDQPGPMLLGQIGLGQRLQPRQPAQFIGAKVTGSRLSCWVITASVMVASDDKGRDGMAFQQRNRPRINRMQQQLMAKVRLHARSKADAHRRSGVHADKAINQGGHGVSFLQTLNSIPQPHRIGRVDPAQSRCDLGGKQFNQAQDKVMRRIDRMDLNGDLGGMVQHPVGGQRICHLVRRADMAVHRQDQIVRRIAGQDVANQLEMLANLTQTDPGQSPRFGPAVGHEHRACGQNTR